MTSQLRNSYRRKFPSPHVCHIQLPGGFPYESFDGEAHIKPWNVLSIIEAGRAFSFHPPEDDPNSGFLELYKIYTYGMGFIASCHFEFSPELYDTTVKKSPLSLTKKMLYAGNSSTNIETDVFRPGNKLPLIHSQVQTVIVSRETRKPALFPEWWKEKYQKYSQEDASLHWRLKEKRPKNFSLYSLTTQPSDCDPYRHVNWSNYLKYCCDGLLGLNLKTSKIELKQPQIKTAYFTFIKESNAGEDLSVIFWSKDKQIYFEIENQNNAVIFQAQLELYPP